MSEPATPSLRAVVIGASFAGLLAAAATARAGYAVTVVERDALPSDPGPRDGVPQSRQPHVLLHRGLESIETLLPGIRDDLLARGGRPVRTGELAWLGEYGWLPVTADSYETISLSRPLLEEVVRSRLRTVPGVELSTGERVQSLRRDGPRWQVVRADGRSHTADLVVDASGRGSRLPHWLADLGVPQPEPVVVEAQLGYATRSYRGRIPLRTGAVIVGTPETLAGALAIPVEDDRWLVCAHGYGDRRPPRETTAFETFLADLPDPVFADLVTALEPDGEVSVHRQTANRRYAYGRGRDWPAGLLVVGDAMCAFNPVYGQGITVSAGQAEVLAARLSRRPLDARSTRRLQRRLAAVADFPWSVATSQDLRMPTSPGRQSLVQRAIGRWTGRVMELATGGDVICLRTLGQVYHLMGQPALLFRPAIAAAVVRSWVRGVPPAAPRPTIIDGLAPGRA
ncbi:MAG: hypothetical protein JWP61_2750 [Friedmanniella sp.]|nr:hypothetical protein [Friedmanniella sp.]